MVTRHRIVLGYELHSKHHVTVVNDGAGSDKRLEKLERVSDNSGWKMQTGEEVNRDPGGVEGVKGGLCGIVRKEWRNGCGS